MMTLAEVVQAVRGDEGTQVVLEIDAGTPNVFIEGKNRNSPRGQLSKISGLRPSRLPCLPSSILL
jgi:hypothetical protein